MDKIDFYDVMYGYAAENTKSSKIKVYIPDVFIDKSQGRSEDKTEFPGSKNIFINSTPPALSNSIVSKNYITLSTINDKLSVSINDRLLIGFVGKNPRHGHIIGKVLEG